MLRATGIWGFIVALFISITVQANCSRDPIGAAVANQARSEADLQRDKTSKPVEVLRFFGVKPGMTVLDLFAGGGYYSEILSYVVGPNGQVVSHNNKAYLGYVGDELANRYKDNRLPNVTTINSEADNLGLESDRYDLILMVLAYHDIYYTSDYWPPVDRDAFFAQLYASLKPGGTLAIVDHAAKAGTGKTAAQELHRIDEAFARKDFESAGFIFEGSSDVLRNPDDTRELLVFDDKIRRKTDRFVYKFTKPSEEAKK